MGEGQVLLGPDRPALQPVSNPAAASVVFGVESEHNNENKNRNKTETKTETKTKTRGLHSESND